MLILAVVTCGYCLVACIMASKDDLFRLFGANDKLDRVNYPMWSFMMKHVLVAKNLWNIVVSGNEPRPIKANTPSSSDVSNASSSAGFMPPKQEQI